MLLGRYVFRDSVKAKALKYKTFGAIDKAVEKEVNTIKDIFLGVEVDFSAASLAADSLQPVQLLHGHHRRVCQELRSWRLRNDSRHARLRVLWLRPV